MYIKRKALEQKAMDRDPELMALLNEYLLNEYKYVGAIKLSMADMGVDPAYAATMPSANMESRRWRMFWMPEQYLADIMKAVANHDRTLSLPKFKHSSLPANATIDRFAYEPWHRRIGVVFFHPSFDIVLDGMDTPQVPGTECLEMEIVAFECAEDRADAPVYVKQ